MPSPEQARRAVRRALSEMPDIWVSVQSARIDQLVEPLDHWVDQVSGALDVGEVMHTASTRGARTGRCLVGFAIPDPRLAMDAFDRLHGVVTAVDDTAEIGRVPNSGQTHASTQGSLYVQMMPRWRADAYQRQQSRLAASGGSGPLELADMDLPARTGLLNVVTRCALGDAASDGVRYYASSQSFDIETSRDDAEEVFRWGATREVSSASIEVTVPGQVSRRVTFQYLTGGVLAETVYLHDLPPAEALLDQAREQLIQSAPYVESAFALTAQTDSLLASNLLGFYTAGRDLRSSEILGLTLLDPRKIVDAFPLHYLGPLFDGRPQLLDQYRVEHIADGRVLTHRDAAKWFDPARLLRPNWMNPPAELSGARTELDEIIANPGDVVTQKARLRAWRQADV